jgi:hypothetical protein
MEDTMEFNMREHIRWMLTRDTDAPMQEINVDQSDAAIISAFTVATERALGEAPTPDAVRRLVSGIRGTYVKEESLQPVQAEAVIRAAFGEEALLEGISYRDTVRIQLSVTYGIVQSLKFSEPEFETYLDEVARLAEDLGVQGR